MVLEVVDNGSIQVSYDDGTAAGMAIVSAFDEDGDLLFEQNVNKDGTLSYDQSMNVHRFVADDGMGHRATSMTNETSWLKEIPISLRALLGISLLLLIASIFHYRHQVKRLKEE